MQIMIIPGPRDEQKIHQIKLNREKLSEEDWEAFVSHCADNEESLDALYYACGESQEALAEQAKYFHDLLITDERDYYACRVAKIECHY